MEAQAHLKFKKIPKSTHFLSQKFKAIDAFSIQDVLRLIMIKHYFTREFIYIFAVCKHKQKGLIDKLWCFLTDLQSRSNSLDSSVQ